LVFGDDTMADITTQPAKLKRSVTLPLLTFYGLGTIIGAGIYVLIGEVVGFAGIYAPISFVLAAIISVFSAFSFAELSSRFPYSAGEAIFVYKGLQQKWLSTLIGWMVVATGIISSATLARGIIGYAQIFIPIPGWLAIILLALSVGILVVWGIAESVTVAAITTLIEIGGLLFVIIIAHKSFTTLPARWHELIPPIHNSQIWLGIIMGSFIAFFAFIGYEDMVNIAEEVKKPRRNIPIGIILAITISTLLYFLIALVAILSLPIKELAHHAAPLALIVQKNRPSAVDIIGIISLIAVINGVLIQTIMASRVIYGLATSGSAPQFFSKINRKTQTPVYAIVLTIVAILMLALWFPIITLAKTTSFIILIIFTFVNLSLIIIKRKTPCVENAACYSIWIPIIGMILCLALLIFGIWVML
jgi:basic amino acid/polyamine antiporter, APA family